MTINFYTYTGHMDTVTKTLGAATQMSGTQVPGNQSVAAPVINIHSTTVPTFNYAYITEFGKYYFLNQPVWIGSTIYQYTFMEDVLMSNAAAIKAQSGVVRYSNQGRTDIYDPRIAFESVPSVAITQTAVTDNIYYVLRYWSMGGFSNRMTAAFMDAASFACFYEAYNDLAEADRVIAGTSIIDVTEVHYLNSTGVQSLNTRTLITFRNAESSTAVDVDLADAASYTSGITAYFIDSVSDVNRLSYKDFDTGATWTDGYFWSGMSHWRLMLPYAGEVSLRPIDTGFYQITYCALRVAYEPFENSYIITPYINDRALTGAQQTIPVQTDFAFPIDTSFDNISGNRIASYLSTASGVIGGVSQFATGAATYNPLQVGAGLVSTASSIVGSINSLEALRVREGTAGIQFVGSTGGSPAYTATLDGTKIYWFRTTGVPRAGYANFWAAYGKPDGAYRALSTLSGYAEVADVRFTGYGITPEENREIVQKLASGVYF